MRKIDDRLNAPAQELAELPRRGGDLAATGLDATATKLEVDVAPARFYECASSFSDFNLYQTPAFGAVMASAQGAQTSNIIVLKDRVPIGACMLRIKTIPVLGWGVAYALGGPLWQHPRANLSGLADVLAAIRFEYGCRRRLSVWLKPRLWLEAPDAVRQKTAFRANEFRSCPNQKTVATLLLDLRPPVDDLRRLLHRSWRRYLLKAERGGLEVSTDREDASFAALLPLYAELKKVKGFRGIDGESMRRVNAGLPGPLRMQTTLCRRGGRVVAGQIASQLGNSALGVIGAANAEGREVHAAYLVWWERLLRAKEGNCIWYDMGGFDDQANPSVAQAKLRMGGRHATFLGEFRFNPTKQRAWLVSKAEALRHMLRSL